jgi:hypothetical protein
MLSVIMLSVVMLNVIMLSVVAPIVNLKVQFSEVWVILVKKHANLLGCPLSYACKFKL